jgi:hypothetical protein
MPTDRARPNQFSLEIPPDLREGLLLLKERDGVPVAESIRRAIRAWLEARDAIETHVAPTKRAVRRAGRRGGKR